MTQEISHVLRRLPSCLRTGQVLVESAGLPGATGAGNVLSIGKGRGLIERKNLVMDLRKSVVALGGAVAITWGG